MRCVAINASGQVFDVVPQPAVIGECTLVLASPAEIGNSLFALSLEEGGLISGAICLLWASAYGMRLLRKSLT